MMNQNFRKLFVFLLILTLSIGLVSKSDVYAKDNLDESTNTIYEDEIEASIVSGDGTSENPYILDYDKAPMFKEYIEEKAEQLIYSLNYSESVYSLSSMFDGVLNGTSHYSQTKGGYWNYKSDAPSVIYNGMIWMRKIEYISKADVLNYCAYLSSGSAAERFKGYIPDIAGFSASFAISYLVKKGISTAVATSLAAWAGCGTTFFAAAILLSEYSTFISEKPYLDARDAGKGLLHAQFYTSYQGQWYSHSLSDVWTSYSTAKEPNTYYGKGTYVSK